MRILVTGARGNAGAVTIARMLWSEQDMSGTDRGTAYVIIEDPADLFTPEERPAAGARAALAHGAEPRDA